MAICPASRQEMSALVGCVSQPGDVAYGSEPGVPVTRPPH